MAHRLLDIKTITYWDEGELLDVLEFDGSVKDAVDALSQTGFFEDDYFEDNDDYSSIEDVAKELLEHREWTDDDEHVFCIGMQNPMA